MADIVYDATVLPDAYVGEVYAVKVPTHGAATVITASSITVGALPTGLALGAVAGKFDEVFGTPTVPGQYTFTVSLTDSAGAVTGVIALNVWGVDQAGLKDSEAPGAEGGLTEKAVELSEWPVVQ